MKQPHFVNEISDADGKVVHKNEVKDILDITDMSDELIEVQKGLEAAVSSELGTAQKLNDLPISVAGKTGSAQILGNTKTNAFFVGYAPAESPQLAIIVLIEDAKEGSLNTIPIVKDVLQWYYEHRMTKNGGAESKN